MARGDYPSAKQEQFNLRLPDGMRERIAKEARRTGRSMNAEIVHRLARSLDAPDIEDTGFNIGEDLNIDLMNAAHMSGRTLRDEALFRLARSFVDYQDHSELVRQNWIWKKQYDELMSLFVQLTPVERRMLEQRAQLANDARTVNLDWKDMQKWVDLYPLHNKGRHVLIKSQKDKTEPVVDYDA